MDGSGLQNRPDFIKPKQLLYRTAPAALQGIYRLMKTINLTIIYFFLTILCALSASAENTFPTDNAPKAGKAKRTFVLWGHVRDAFTKAPVKDVKITLMNGDSTVIDTCTALSNIRKGTSEGDAWYSFTLPATPQKVIIRASHPEYEDCFVDYEVSHVARNRYFDAPWHYMRRLSSSEKTDYDLTLDSLVVTGTRIKMTYRGDTLVYDAAAFKLPDGSMLDALVRQMPGAELDDKGVITINGRKVDYIMLNGKDFFKGQNKVMLDNLPYYTVKNVQVYERMTDKSRFMNKNIEQKEYVMNVNMKREYKNGWLGNTGEGIASDAKYMARIFASRFTDLSNFAVYANVNNINETSNPDNQGNWGSNSSFEGKVTYRTAGIMLRTNGKKNWHENILNIQGAWRDKSNHTSETSETDITTQGSYSSSELSSDRRTRTLSLSNTYRMKLPIWLESITSLEVSDNRDFNKQHSATFNSPSKDDMSMLNRLVSLTHAETRQTAFSERATLNKKLPWGDNMEMETRVNYTHRASDTNEDYRLDYAHSPSDHRQTFNQEPQRKLYLYGRGEYYINALNDWTWRFYSLYEYSRDDTPRRYYRLDRLPGWAEGSHPLECIPAGDSLSIVLSPDGSHTLKRNTGRLNYGFNIYLEKQTDSTYTWLRFHLPVYHTNERMTYQKAATDTCAHRTMMSLDGNINFTHKWNGKRNSISANLWHRTIMPDLSDMVVFDFCNPLAVILNNTTLRNAEQWSTSFAYRRSSSDGKRSFSGNTYFSYMTNQILQCIGYNAGNGGYTYQKTNGDYECTWNNYAQITGSTGRWTYDIGTYCNFSKGQTAELDTRHETSDFVLHDASSINIGPHVNFGYQHNSLAVDLRNYYYRGWVRYKDHSLQDKSTYTYSSTLTARYTIPLLKLQLSSSLEWNKSVSSLDNTPPLENWFWHASVSRSLLKGNRLILQVTAVDILHSVKTMAYVTSNDSRTFTRRNTERNGSYVMMSAAYNFYSK